MKCACCGEEFVPRNSKQKFCSKRCAGLYSCKNLPKANPLPKKLEDWCREARDCNLDYGNYRAMRERGKTYEELKAIADVHGKGAHSKKNWHLARLGGRTK